MIFVGERINAGFDDIQRDTKEKDISIIQRWAKIQTKVGVDVAIYNVTNEELVKSAIKAQFIPNEQIDSDYFMKTCEES